MPLTRREFCVGTIAAGAARGILALPPQDPFILRYLQLCRVSQASVDQITRKLTDLAFVTADRGSIWRCEWGPGYDHVQANLALVTSYGRSARAAPDKLVLIIRGTSFTGYSWGNFEQGFENLVVTRQAPLPWAPDLPARIAIGTLDGLRMMNRLRSAGVGIREFLRRRLAGAATRPKELVITGHSLGGCLAGAIALLIQDDLTRNGITIPIRLVTFAAPTAGNAAFAHLLTERIPNSLHVFNTLDVVPMIWSELAGIKTIYARYGALAPIWAAVVLDLFAAALRTAQITYCQPSSNRLALPGRYVNGLDWNHQIAAQHRARAYMRLLGDASAVIPPLRPRDRYLSHAS